ncbi:LuxR C-terminal-related transcriptional regulator [Prescottella defluvii]|nr:LuxR C-terminal-related transcriptional regulator [Prescottella defluvii]
MHVRRPIRLAFLRLEVVADRGVDEQIHHLVDVCPMVDVVVTVSGRALFPYRGTLESTHHLIDGEVLRHNLDDMREAAESAGIELRPGELEILHDATGGLPALTGVVLEVAAELPTLPRRAHLLEDRVGTAVTAQVEATVLATTAAVEHRSFLTRMATAHFLTTRIAQFLDGNSDPAQCLRALEDAGVVDHLDTADGDTWILPPAVRDVLFEGQRADGLHPEARLVHLANHHLAHGEPGAALRCATDARQWALVTDIVETHLATLVGADLSLLSQALRAIPPRMLVTRLRTDMTRELLALLHGDLPPNARIHGPHKSAPPRTLPELRLATHHTMVLRLSGAYERAAEATDRLRRTAASVLESAPHDLTTNDLPFLRMQWSLTYQLAGQFPDAVSELWIAHRLGQTQGQQYIARNAAGNTALLWALAGDHARVHEWLELEHEHAHATTDTWADALTRIGGLTAQALAALDMGDTTQSERALEELEDLPPVVELWPFVVHARSRHAIATLDPASGLEALSKFTTERARVKGEFARSLVDATELEIHLALGDGGRAMKLARNMRCDHPWDTVAAARAHLLTGRHHTAINICRRYDWLASPYIRFHLDSLIIEAVALNETGNSNSARHLWTRACDIARRTGCASSLSGVPGDSVAALAAVTGTSFPLASDRPHYPAEVHFPDLTDREDAVLNGLAQGMTAGEIADALLLATSTVKSHLRTLYRKLDVHTRREAVDAARDLGFLDDPRGARAGRPSRDETLHSECAEVQDRPDHHQRPKCIRNDDRGRHGEELPHRLPVLDEDAAPIPNSSRFRGSSPPHVSGV